jgi:hypothetical protein
MLTTERLGLSYDLRASGLWGQCQFTGTAFFRATTISSWLGTSRVSARTKYRLLGGGRDRDVAGMERNRLQPQMSERASHLAVACVARR